MPLTARHIVVSASVVLFCTAVDAQQQYHFTGRVCYLNPDVSDWRGVHGVFVEVMDQDFFADSVVTTTRTDENGYFSATAEWQDGGGGDNHPDFYLRVSLVTDAVAVETIFGDDEGIIVLSGADSDGGVWEEFEGTHLNFGDFCVGANRECHIINIVMGAAALLPMRPSRPLIIRHEGECEYREGDFRDFHQYHYEDGPFYTAGLLLDFQYWCYPWDWTFSAFVGPVNGYAYHMLVDRCGLQPIPDECGFGIVNSGGLPTEIYEQCLANEQVRWAWGFSNWFYRWSGGFLGAWQNCVSGDADVPCLLNAVANGFRNDEPHCATDQYFANRPDWVVSTILNHQITRAADFVTAYRDDWAPQPPERIQLWRTANAYGYAWPDTDPPGAINGLTSPSHPTAFNSGLRQISIRWTDLYAGDQDSGASEFSYVFTTGSEMPDLVSDSVIWANNGYEATSASLDIGTYRFRIRARDCAGNWSSQVAEYGPVIIDNDCNQNGTPDTQDLLTGVSSDCNSNLAPDECEPGYLLDCNTNGLADFCDIAGGMSMDCQVNGMPDECDVATIAADLCSAAPLVTSGPTYQGMTIFAMGDGSTTCGHSNNNVDVWYRYRPIRSGIATISLCTITDYDSVLSVHRVSCPGTIDNTIACNDDFCQPRRSEVTFIAQGGQTYWIRISGYIDNSGAFGMQLSGPAGQIADCNTNSTPDECEIASNAALDCNNDRILDVCEFANGDIADCNSNNVPDECEVGLQPSIVTHPEPAIAMVGTHAELSVTAGGAAPLQYQWEKLGAGQWIPIVSAMERTIVVDPATLNATGDYRVRISNGCGSVTSVAARLTVVCAFNSTSIDEYTAPMEQRRVFTRDIELDGDDDIITLNRSVNGSSFSVYRRQADGSFAPRADYTAPGQIGTMAVGVMDGDAYPDVVIRSEGEPAVLWLFANDHAGAFELASASPFAACGTPDTIAVGDIDNGSAGEHDVAMACVADSSVMLMLNAGGGQFSQQGVYSTGIEPRFVEIADLDGDGDGDLIVVGTQANAVAVLRNTGGGLFAAPQTYPVGAGPDMLIVRDMNGDTRPDIVTANFGGGSLTVLQGRPDGGFTRPMRDLSVGGLPTAVAASDFDGDGGIDLAATNPFSGSVALLRRAGDAYSTPQLITIGGGLTWLATGDFDGSGGADLAVVGMAPNQMHVIRLGAGGPSIMAEPTDQSACALASATFAVFGEGTGTVSYQWRWSDRNLSNGVHFGGNVLGARTPTLALWNIVPGVFDQEPFEVVLTDACGRTVSRQVALTIYEPPTITSQPHSAASCAGTNVSFQVNAVGPSPVFQWRRLVAGQWVDLIDDGHTLGVTTSMLEVQSVQLSDSGQYNLLVSNSCGSIASDTVTLTVRTPLMATIPDSMSVCEGDLASSISTIQGGIADQLQWRRFVDGIWQELEDDDRIDGANTWLLTIDPVRQSDAGAYDILVSNACGTVTSNIQMLRVPAITPRITLQPMSIGACGGEAAIFSTMATDAHGYQWRRFIDQGWQLLVDDGRVSGATLATLVIQNVTQADAGEYDVVISNGCGISTSDAATLMVSSIDPCSIHALPGAVRHWDNPSTWNLNRVPSAGDDVCIPTGATAGDTLEHAIYSGIPSAIARMCVNRPFVFTAGEISSSGRCDFFRSYSQTALCTLGGTGDIFLHDSAAWGGGYMRSPSPGPIGLVDVTGTLTFMPGAKVLDHRRLVMRGTTTLDGSTSPLQLQNAAAMELRGAFTLRNSGGINGGTVSNHSTFTRDQSPGPDTTSHVYSVFNNQATVHVVSGKLTLGNGNPISTSEGQFVVSNNAQLAFGSAHQLTSTSSIIGAGTVEFASGSGAIDIHGTHNVTGVTRCTSSAVIFHPGAAITTLGARLEVRGGRFQLDSGSPVSISHLLLGGAGGTLAGADAMTVTGTTTWEYGGIDGPATEAAALHLMGPVTITSTGPRIINARRVVLHDTATVSDGNGFHLNSGAELRNAVQLEWYGDGDVGRSAGVAGIINNLGTFIKTSGTTTDRTQVQAVFNNSGLTRVQQGTLQLGNGEPAATSIGEFEALSGTALVFNASHELTSSSHIHGGGQAIFEFGTINVRGRYDIHHATVVSGLSNVTFHSTADVVSVGVLGIGGIAAVAFASGELIAPTALNVSAGTLTGSDAITIAGATTWSGGMLSGTNALTHMGATNWTGGTFSTPANMPADSVFQGALNIAGPGNKSVSQQRTMRNLGIATWTDSGELVMAQSARVVNLGIFNVLNASRIRWNGGSPVFDNRAAFNKNSGGTTFVSTRFDNSGGVRISQGELRFDGGSNAPFTQTGGDTVLDGGSLASAAGTPLSFEGGALRGIGTITGNVSNVGATIRPGAPTGSLSIMGSYSQLPGGAMEIELDGSPGSYSYDSLTISGVATLAGTLQIRARPGFLPQIGDSFVVVTAGNRAAVFTSVVLDPPTNWAIVEYSATTVRVTIGAIPEPSLPGDVNCDGDIDGLDIAAFVLALLDPAGYSMEFPSCNPLRGDLNGNGVVDSTDAVLMASLLVGPG